MQWYEQGILNLLKSDAAARCIAITFILTTDRFPKFNHEDIDDLSYL